MALAEGPRLMPGRGRTRRIERVNEPEDRWRGLGYDEAPRVHGLFHGGLTDDALDVAYYQKEDSWPEELLAPTPPGWPSRT